MSDPIDLQLARQLVQEAYRLGADDTAQALHLTFRDNGHQVADFTVRGLTRSHSYDPDKGAVASDAAHDLLRDLLGEDQTFANQEAVAEAGLRAATERS